MTEDLTLTIILNCDALTATVTTTAGDTIATPAVPYDTLTLEPGHLEQRPDDWCHAFTAAVDALRPHTDLAAVTTITLTGDLRAILFLDSDREPIRNAILIDDERARDGAPSVLQWMRANQTIAFKRIQYLTTPRGYLRLRLTGQHALDPEDAVSTALLDPATNTWSPALCDAHEINPDILPRIVEHEALPLTAAVSATLGLTANII